MSPRIWLLLLILSVTVSGEAMLWALAHGQFHNVERGRWMPLRPQQSPLNASRHRPRALAIYMIGLGTAIALLLYTVGSIVLQISLLKP